MYYSPLFKSIKFKISLAVRNTYSFIIYLFIYLSEEIRREGGRKEGEREEMVGKKGGRGERISPLLIHFPNAHNY